LEAGDLACFLVVPRHSAGGIDENHGNHNPGQPITRMLPLRSPYRGYQLEIWRPATLWVK